MGVLASACEAGYCKAAPLGHRRECRLTTSVTFIASHGNELSGQAFASRTLQDEHPILTVTFGGDLPGCQRLDPAIEINVPQGKSKPVKIG
jgi:hypothetical protein